MTRRNQNPLIARLTPAVLEKGASLPISEIHQVSTAAVDLGILTGVLGPRTLRPSVQLRLGFSGLGVLPPQYR